MIFFTIGVYNSKEEEFFTKLKSNNIDTFCDIRQRRGVRGSKYAFVNSKRLQQKLDEIGIRYVYFSQLAPTTEIRSIQKEIDLARGEIKSKRGELGDIFIIEYKNKILNKFDFNSFINHLNSTGASKVALFCVEENSKACHRSIVANKLNKLFNYQITNL